MELLDIDKAFNLKVKVPLLNEREMAKVLGANIGIQNPQPIRKIMQFRDSTLDGSPPSEWKTKWKAFSS